MTLSTATLLGGLCSYLIGGVPIGLLVSRVKGVDVRRVGSGNIGATNVGRVLGLRWGLFVFVLDVLKGWLPTVAASRLIISTFQASHINQAWLDTCWIYVGFCAVIGHIFSPYLRLRGGKGVATSFGVALGVYPELTYPAVLALLVWVVVVYVCRMSSAGSLAAALTLPLGYVAVSMVRGIEILAHWPFLGFTIVAAILLVTLHRANIARLVAGTEARLGSEPRR